MRALLRYAGLKADQEQRVRLAAGALAANNIRALASPWDGTRCDLVLVNADDSYGQHVMAIARRREVPVLAFSRVRTGTDAGVSWVREDSSAAALAWLALSLLTGTIAEAHGGRLGSALHEIHPASPAQPEPETQAPAPSAASNVDLAILRMVSDPLLSGKDVEAHVGGRTAFLLPSTGRVLTATLSDQVGTRERLCDDGWTFRPISRAQAEKARFEVSVSLDAWLLQGALRHEKKLPEFPDRPCRLQDWPDLGSSPEAVHALRIVQALHGGPVRPSVLAQTCNLDPVHVSACLWAFAAAGLMDASSVTDAGSAPPRTVSQSAQTKANPGLFARIAAHFGLGRT